MRNTLFRSLLLLVSIPLLNSIAFGIGTLVHEMHISTITHEQYLTYQNAMVFMILAVGVAIFTIEMLYDLSRINNQVANVLYVISFLIAALGTANQFTFRPFEHSLTFMSVITVLASRHLLNKRLLKTRTVESQYS